MKEKLRSDFLSRQKMIRNNFEIYYYSDTEPMHVSPHIHDNYEIQFFLEGDVQCFINGQEHTLKAQDVVIIPPHARHFNKIRSGSPYRRCIFWVSREFIDALRNSDSCYGYFLEKLQENRYFWHFTASTFNALQARIISLIESGSSARFGREARTELAAVSLILRLNEAIYEQCQPFAEKEEQSLMERLLTFIQTHLEEDLSLDRLASEFFVSKYYISHLFKAEMGISLHQYVLKKRLDQVRIAMLSGEELTPAIEKAGFKTYSSFFRAFQKEFGMSPTEYRKKWSIDTIIAAQNDSLASLVDSEKKPDQADQNPDSHSVF